MYRGCLRFNLSLSILALWVGCLGTILSAPVAATPTPISEPQQFELAPVIVWNREITIIRAGFANLTPAQRAKGIADRIENIPSGQGEYKVEATDATLGKYTGAWISVNGKIIFGLLTEDADSETRESFAELKRKTVENLESWLAVREEQEKWPSILKGIGLSVVASLASLLILLGVLRLSNRWMGKRSAAIHDPSTKPISMGDVNIKPYLITLEIGLYKLLLWAFNLGLGYLWLTYVFNQFPYSHPWGENLKNFLFDLFADFIKGIVEATPDLFTVLVIFLLTRLIVRVTKAFFFSAESGLVSSAWLHPETARTTRRLVVVLIWIFAAVVAYPYIPGSQTEAFKGVSVFLGLMLSLGSAGMVGQIVGGLVVVYSRAFRTGEYVKVGEFEGTIKEIGLLSTKMQTPKHEEITIPNAVLVGSTTINYSRHDSGGGAVLSTAVTIGYDAPWRQVHALLLLAAERTSGILNDPPPRVLQRSLSDFYVEYQLLFRIMKPAQRYVIMSELHGHIQDAFNEYGVQIMSPHFEMQPSDTIVVPASEWRKAPAKHDE